MFLLLRLEIWLDALSPLPSPEVRGGLGDCCLGKKIQEVLRVTVCFPESEVAGGWPTLKGGRFMFLQRTRPWGGWGGRAGGGKGGAPHSFMTQERQIETDLQRRCE